MKTSHATNVQPFPATDCDELLPCEQELAESFERLIADQAIIPHFQPIRSVRSDMTVGYELLARSTVPRLQNPLEMFRTAEYLGRAAELSELCRKVGYRHEKYLPREAALFVNIHPSEPLLTGLLPSLRRMRQSIPDRCLIVEIHEGSVTDPATLNEFIQAIRLLNVRLAFDDFGVGRSRLLELACSPPDFVKLDASMIRNLQVGPRHRQTVIRHLVEMIHDVGCKVVAEGVETSEDLANCVTFGFDSVQGYLLGRPLPVSQFESP